MFSKEVWAFISVVLWSGCLEFYPPVLFLVVIVTVAVTMAMAMIATVSTTVHLNSIRGRYRILRLLLLMRNVRLERRATLRRTNAGRRSYAVNGLFMC